MAVADLVPVKAFDVADVPALPLGYFAVKALVNRLKAELPELFRDVHAVTPILRYTRSSA